MNTRRKPNPQSVIDTKLTTEQAAAFFAQAGKMKLDKAAKLLKEEFGIELHQSNIARWLERQRRDNDFQERLIQLREVLTRSGEIQKKFGDLGLLSDTNIKLLNQDLTMAQLSGDKKAVSALVEQLSYLLDGYAKMKRANAALADSDTARQKFQFDAAKEILKRMPELLKIHTSADGQREKIQAIVESVFGQRPDNLNDDGTPREVTA